jgi:hypothetical protein
VRFFRRGGSFERLRDRGGAPGTAEVAILSASSVEVAVSCEFSPEVAILGRCGVDFRTRVPSRGKKCSRLPPRAHRRTRLPFRGQECTELPPRVGADRTGAPPRAHRRTRVPFREQECTELPPRGGLTAGNRRLAARGLPDTRHTHADHTRHRRPPHATRRPAIPTPGESPPDARRPRFRRTGALPVRDTGIEPVTSSVSGKRATAAPIALDTYFVMYCEVRTGFEPAYTALQAAA